MSDKRNYVAERFCRMAAEFAEELPPEAFHLKFSSASKSTNTKRKTYS